MTNENCLVLHARDAAQADALVTKYLGPDDAFVHADSPAAPVTIVKAPPVRSNSLGGDLSGLHLNRTAVRGGSRADGWCGRVPPVSLIQAGAACLCRSSAWDSRHVVSAFWIPPENVRKVTPTGDPLAVGVVWHVGQKTFLPPAPLVMGFGCVFLLGDEAGVEAHLGDRVTKSALRSDGGEGGVKIDVKAEEEDEEGDEEIPEEPEAPTEEAPAVGNAQLDAFLDGGVDFGGRVDTKKEDEDAKEEQEEEKEDEEEPNDDEEDANGDGNKSTAGKVRISAKERRLMKKQRKKGDDGGSDDDVHDPIKQTTAEKPAEAQPQQQKQQTQQPANTNKPLPRGKSSKAKKAAKKYADQDDEDRELAIALARASGKRGKKGGKGKGGLKGGDSSSDEEVMDPIAAKAKQNNSRDRADANRDKSTRQHGAGTGKEGGHARAGRRGGHDVDDDEPVLEDPAVFAARDVERMSRVDWFTGAPTESDAIDFAVCVVAPYQALQSFRYKVKLTPGTQKKGKAGKQALDILCKAPASVMGNSVGGGRDQSREEKEREGAFDARCKEMMRSAEGAAGDLAQLMCGGGVKVSMPAGAAKAMNAGRKGKR